MGVCDRACDAFTLFTPAGQQGEPVVAAEEEVRGGAGEVAGSTARRGGGRKLELRFDNGHSMIRSKTVRWRAAAADAS